MYLLTAPLFLSVLVMVQADRLSDFMDKPALPEQIYLFVVTSDACVDDLKASFDVIGQPRHSFKVIGEPVYYFAVTAGRNTTTLRQLTFPRGSVVEQFPMEHINDYFNLVGAEKWEESDENLADTVLTLEIWEFHFPAGTSVKDYDAMVGAYARQYKNTAKRVKRYLAYVPVSTYPPKIFYFSYFEVNALQHVIKNGLDVTGGVGNVVGVVKRIVKI